jgi:hypothetical protein
MPAAPDLPTLTAQPPAGLILAAPPPLLAGEDTAAYDVLLARMTDTVRPADILEEIWLRDVVDLVWEVLRLRRLKAGLLTATAHEGMAQVLRPLTSDSFETAQKWAAREAAAVARVERLLADAGLGMDAVMGRTLALRIREVERIDVMTTAAEARRNAALHEIERHRHGFAQVLRRAAHEIDDDDVEILPYDEEALEKLGGVA